LDTTGEFDPQAITLKEEHTHYEQRGNLIFTWTYCDQDELAEALLMSNLFVFGAVVPQSPWGTLPPRIDGLIPFKASLIVLN
jgi:hypothetical protein